MTDRPSMHALKQRGLAPKGVSQPEVGFYEMRDWQASRWVPVHIWHGPHKDPATGEECDRSPRWQALVDGKEADPIAIWPSCCARPITREQYLNMLLEDEDGN